ncbi:putative receptor-like protein kinase At3g47110 [Triticum dicoccoides]|uniref:putative receptor-like protein kinase At3g47110 n=1 Tax=Triticum dicoccoides TaxID=85692 RepID=UPI0018913759|nr:putative receptor-like protein kinase At3g47110 [Triticum dicoccoides]
MSFLCSLVTLLLIVAVSADDEAALLAFKAQLSHGGSLASWNSSAGFCSWEGVTCHRTPARVVALRLSSTGLAGTLSPAIGNLSFLRTLDLSSNSFHGDIPASLGRLRRLQKLILYDNSFSGTLPVNLSSCVSITEMNLDNNTLGGRIPAELGEKLTYLSLRQNSFTGLIPASLGNMSHLQLLDLTTNQLVGSIPSGLGSIQSMIYFSVAVNLVTGMIPHSLYNWSSLEVFSVGGNMLDGSIPDDIASKFPKLKYLALGSNHFTGIIPSSISNISSLILLDLVDNRFSGQLRFLVLYTNSFGGQLPGSIVNLSTTLQQLNLMDNRISGSIPADIGNLIGLERLAIGYTGMYGVIPESIGKLANLIELVLCNNSLSGLIPSSLGNLSWLNRLDASEGNLEGPIPVSLGELKNLFVLDLSNNYHLNGSVPREIFKLPGLSWYLNLSYNSLSGPIPNEVGSLANLNELVLSGNQLSGKIPDSIQNCVVLEWLLLDSNSFEGSIPKSLKNIKGLRTLNLTMNNFSGNIPEALGSIGNLQELYLAHNNLSGSITSVLQDLTRLSELDISFNNLQGEKLKPSQNTLAHNSIADDHYERIPYQALMRGTDGFSEVNLLGRGSYGVVYKCVLDTEERTFAVKVFARYSKSFEAECEAMRRIRHRCIIKIITSCSSVNHQGQEFKALVFEFMPNGNLDGWLHKKSQEPTRNNTLNLSQRLDIAVDIVDAIEYLHNYCQPLVIHCDLKPSNILLAEDMSARVGDFGISRIFEEKTSKGMQTSYSSTRIRGTIGYVAPEYGEGSAVSAASDIYSLGILLLEMFTGRSPTEVTFRDSLDLHKFAEDALPDRALEIADPTMWLHRGQHDDTTSIRIHELLASVFRLGISCSKQQPRDRALTRDAATEMHAIRDAYLKFIGERGAEREVSTQEIQNIVE